MHYAALHRPALRRLWHNGMVGVRTGHRSSASGMIVWLVYAKVAVTMRHAASQDMRCGSAVAGEGDQAEELGDGIIYRMIDRWIDMQMTGWVVR